MRIASDVEIRESMGFDDMDDVNAAIQFALDTVTGRLEVGLRTQFARADWVDVFFVDDAALFRGQPITRLRLSHGFVDPDTLDVSYATLYDSLASSADRTATAALVLEAEKGLLTTASLDLTGNFVRVAYTAGFAADGTVDQQYDLSTVPVWLQTLAKLYVRIELNAHPLFKNADKATDPAALVQSARMIHDGHVRFYPSAFAPVARIAA